MEHIMKLVFHISTNDTFMSLYFAHFHYIVEVLTNFWAIINLTVNRCSLCKRKLSELRFG